MKITDQHYDVAVFGGGLCGFAAARSCARAGLKALVIESRQVLGWESTWAFALDFTGGDSDASSWLAAASKKAGGARNGRLDAPILEMLLDRELDSSGADLLLYSQPVAVALNEEGVGGVVIGGKEGELVIRATAFIDATENAILWRLAGGEVDATESPGVFAAFLNGADVSSITNRETPITAPGVESIALKPGVWPGEVAVEFTLPTVDVCGARCALPAVLRAVREQSGAFTEAMVSHVSVEPFPLQPIVSVSGDPIQHPRAGNLFAGGAWATPRKSDRGSIAQRLDFGDEVAGTVRRLLPGLPEQKGAVPSVQSVAAPPAYSSDVLVCGGGTAGAIAGIAAAREGAKTTLLEASTFLGGIGSGGGIHIYYHGVTGGIQDEVDERVKEMTPLFGPPRKVVGFHPEVKKVVLQQMAEEAGVDLVFQTTITGAEVEEVPSDLPARKADAPARQLKGVNIAGPEGAATYRATVVVDSTGDADVAFMAGAPFTYGRETDNLPHAYSLAAGRVDADAKLMVTNFDAGYCDPTDVEDLTRARRLGLKHYYREEFLTENRLAYLTPLIGLRNSRQIIGEYRLTFFDEVAGREFPDVIAYAYSHYDNHAFDYGNESDETMLWVWMLGNWHRRIGCEIPYRCLLPREVEGLLVACRAISITHDAHNQLRMQRDMQLLGEAAGIAAALAVKENVFPRALPVLGIQEKLLESGALGDRKQKELPPGEPIPVHTSRQLTEKFPERPTKEWIDGLDGKEARQAVWQLCQTGEDTIPALLEAVNSESEEQRFWASVALAVLKREEAVPALLDCVRQRCDEVPEKAIKNAPIWMPSMVLLGRIGDPQAGPVIAEVLTDPESILDALIAAVRALGRLGDPAAIPHLEEMLARDDLPVMRTLQKSTGAASEVIEDARWQLELAAAEALANLGAPRPALIEPYRADNRAYVRRYAEKVKRMFERGS